MSDVTTDVRNRTTVSQTRPLVVDLDGTLLKSDMLFETFFDAVGRNPVVIATAMLALGRGKAALKDHLAARSEAHPDSLPYDDAVLALIHEAREQGRDVYLASASNERVVQAVADHLGLFTGWMASDAAHNLSGQRKADRLVQQFGEGGFDYIGNDKADLAVWRVCAVAISVRASTSVRRGLDRINDQSRHLWSERAGLKPWLKLLRVHQYVKNGLLMVPLITAHAFNLGALAEEILGIIAFSLCASSVYLLNDLIDLHADRCHATKHKRPLARGAIPIWQAVAAIPVLLLLSAAIGLTVSPAFFGVMVVYYCLTTAYSFVLKRKMLIDVVALAMLYTIRVIAGAVAIDVAISEWLLAFSVFIFMSLALVKRYAELAVRLDLGMRDPTNRNYKISDLQTVLMIATVSGLNAVTVFAMYVSSPDVHLLYREPRVLWLICPVLLYWISRMIMMTHRRWVTEDPIVFAVKDRVSLMTLGVCSAILLVACV